MKSLMDVNLSIFKLDKDIKRFLSELHISNFSLIRREALWSILKSNLRLYEFHAAWSVILCYCMGTGLYS